MAIQPLGDRLLVKLLEAEERTKGGIILPDTAKEKPQEGKIIAIGRGRLLEDGTWKPFEIRVGDKVLFARFSGAEVKHEDEDYLLVKEEDILAVVRDATESPKKKEK